MSDTYTSSSVKQSSLGIANFKAFGVNLQNIPLKPITLVFGPNSGGKSSLLHFFLWLQDMLLHRSPDVYFPSASGESVDLGGFKQLRHGMDPAAEIKMRVELNVRDVRKQFHKIEVLSSLGTCQPSTDYESQLRARVKERLFEILARNPFDALIKQIDVLVEKVIRETLTKLLAAEFGEGKLLLSLNDCFDGEGEHLEPIDKLCSMASPKLHKIVLYKRKPPLIDISSLLDSGDSSVIQEEFVASNEEDIPQITESDLLSELQSLACAVLIELNHKAPPSPEVTPALVGVELREDGKPILTIGRNEKRQFVLKSLDCEWVAAFSGESPQTGREWATAIYEVENALVFDDANSWLPRGLRVSDDSGCQADVEGEGVLRKIATLIQGTEDVPGLLTYCEKAAMKEYGSLSY